MQVDETRDDELAGRVDPLHRPVGRDGGQDRGDLAVLDSEIPLAAEGLARIQHLAIGDDQIELEPGIGGVEAHRQRLPRLSEDHRRRLRAAAWATAVVVTAALVPSLMKSRRDTSIATPSSRAAGRARKRSWHKGPDTAMGTGPSL